MVREGEKEKTLPPLSSLSSLSSLRRHKVTNRFLLVAVHSLFKTNLSFSSILIHFLSHQDVLWWSSSKVSRSGYGLCFWSVGRVFHVLLFLFIFFRNWMVNRPFQFLFINNENWFSHIILILTHQFCILYFVSSTAFCEGDTNVSVHLNLICWPLFSLQWRGGCGSMLSRTVQ
jgi:hypothetical protein